MIHALMTGIIETRRISEANNADEDAGAAASDLGPTEVGLAEWVDLVSEDLGEFKSMIKGLDDNGQIKLSAFEKMIQGENSAKVKPLHVIVAPTGQPNPENEQVKQLKDALDQGLITQEEHDQSTSTIISSS